MSIIRPIVRSIVRSAVSSIMGSVGAARDEKLEAVRDLDQSNGGDFAVSILDFTSRAYSDSAGTTLAGVGDSVAAVRNNLTGEDDEAIVVTQTSAPARPTVTTDALGRTPIETDGGDDRLDLPDGWLGDGTQHVHGFAAIAPNFAGSDANPVIMRVHHSLALFVDTNDNTLRIFQSDGGSAAGKSLPIYSRSLSENETLVVGFLYDPANTLAILYVNGQEVARDEAAYSSQDANVAAALFGQDGIQNLAATAWATVSVVGSRAMTDAEKRAVDEYLAELADVTLAPQTRDEALTVLRRPATPATDLNVTDTFDDGLGAWTDASSGDSSVSASGGNLILQKNSGNPIAQRDPYRVRIGFPLRVTVTAGSNAGNARMQLEEGTSYGTGVANEIVAAGSSTSVEFTPASDTVVLQILGVGSAGTYTFPEVTLTEIPRTTAVYDMLDESRMTDSSSGTQALDAGVEILLPSVADGEDAFGADISPLGSAASIDNGGGMTGSYDESSGTFTAVGTGSSGRPRWRWQIPDANPETLYRVVATHSGDDIFDNRLVLGGTGKNGTEIIANATSTFFITGIPSSSNGFGIFGNGTPGTCQVSITIEAVLHYPLHQTTAPAQPTLRYTLHDYLAGVVFSGKETATGTLSAVLDDDFSSYADQAAAEAAGWTPQQPGMVFDASLDAWTFDGSTSDGALDISLATEIGRPYVWCVGWSGRTVGSVRIAFAGGAFGPTSTDASGEITYEATADTATELARIISASGWDGQIDYVRLEPAAVDLSGNNNGPAVNGSLTVSTPTVDGQSSLSTVYSGFSGSNYLEHTTDHLDPGTGDWSITRVVSISSAVGRAFVEYGQYSGGSYSGGAIFVRQDTLTGGFSAQVTDDGYTTSNKATADFAAVEGQLYALSAVRRGDQLEIWVDGQMMDSQLISAATGTLSGGAMRHGVRLNGSQAQGGSIGSIMLDTSGYAPTADEIASMHADLDAIYNRTADSYVFASLEFDGGDDYFEAVDPDGDLAITGDVTIVAAARYESLSGNEYLVASGDPSSINTDEAYAALVSTNNGRLGLRQADGASNENKKMTSAALALNDTSTVSIVRQGADVTLAVDVQDPETKTFATVTAPTAGASPQTIVGAIEDGSFNFAGSYYGLAIYDGALPTGQVVVLESAMTKLSSGG